MPRFKPKGALERNAAQDLWKHTLSRIPTLYGRLVYLASLRDPNSGAYRHHGLSSVFGREESSRALLENHQEAFDAWIKLPLSEQHSDLVNYLDEIEESRSTVVSHWLRSKAYRMQVPNAAREMERALFYRNLEALLNVLRNA